MILWIMHTCIHMRSIHTCTSVHIPVYTCMHTHTMYTYIQCTLHPIHHIYMCTLPSPSLSLTHTLTHTSTHTHPHTHTPSHTHPHPHTHTHTHTHTLTHTHTHTPSHTHTHTHPHTLTHTHTHTVDIWSVGCIFAEMVRGDILLPGRDCILHCAILASSNLGAVIEASPTGT